MPRYIYAKQPATPAAFAREVGRRERGTVNRSTLLHGLAALAGAGLDGLVVDVDTEGHGGLVVVARTPVPALEAAPLGVTGGWPLYPASWSGRASVVSALALPDGRHVYVGEAPASAARPRGWAHLVVALPALAPALAAHWGAPASGARPHTGVARTAESLLAEARASVARQAEWARQAG